MMVCLRMLEFRLQAASDSKTQEFHALAARSEQGETAWLQLITKDMNPHVVESLAA